MNNGHEHNRRVAWLRMFGAVAAQVQADQAPEAYRALAQEFADFEARRFATACRALATTPKEI